MRGSDPAIALGGADEETSGFAIGNQYGVTANSLLLFELQTEVVALLTESPTLASQSVTVHPAKASRPMIGRQRSRAKSAAFTRRKQIWVVEFCFG